MAVLTEEQTMLRDAAKAWVQEKAPVAALRKARDSGNLLGYAPEAFREMAEMGWAGVVIPEAHGGSEFGYLSLGLVLEELGRTLAASPLAVSAMAVASAIATAGTEAQKSTGLPALASGETIAALAVDETSRHDPARTALKAEAAGDGYRLTGEKVFVAEGMAAGLYLVAARTSGAPGEMAGITLFLVPADAAGLSRAPRHTADSRDYAALTFDGVTVGKDAVLGAADGGGDLLERTLDIARIALSAEMLGMAVQAFETTLDYLKTRVQFGQTIGSFQALQHRAAKMFSELELTRSCVEAALSAIDQNADDLPQQAALAKAVAGDTLNLVSREMVQMHGGIGMTDAHDAGLYLKRARALEALFGTTAWHRDRWGRMQGY
ncbi:MAG: acyl-CoA dehydrogenase [Caulobacter sp.]|nr:acyl-CoA dehydrogenase [Caulobacter sp.]